MVDFDRPGFLLLIPAAILFPGWGRAFAGALAGAAEGAGARCYVRSFFRSCLALAGPRWLTKTTDAAVVLLRDVSASIGPRLQKTRRSPRRWPRPPRNVLQRSSLLASLLSSRPSEARVARSRARGKNDEATDLSAALEFAATLMPADRPSRIVLFSDGVATAGRNPLETAAQLQNVQIDTVPLRAVSDRMQPSSRSNLRTRFGKGEFSTSRRNCIRHRPARPLPSGFIKMTCSFPRCKGSCPRVFRRSPFPICAPRDAWPSTKSE